MPNFLAVKSIISAIAITSSLYHLYTAVFGTPPSLIHRPVHLLFGFLLLYLGYLEQKDTRRTDRSVSLLLGLATVASVAYLISQFEWLITRFPYVSPVTSVEMIIGTVLILLVLEAARRTTGPQLPTVALVFIAYALFGHVIPGGLGHRGLSFEEIIEVSTLTVDGIWGSPIYASSTYVFLFTLFGAFLASSGIGKMFTDFSIALTGRSAGGPAKTAVVASALMGTITGSSTANVVTTGTFTIPLMKARGYRPPYAAAVEAVASTGGQIMPPVMGVAAFLMVEFTGIPYVQVIKHALIPALLYFFSVFMMVHFEAGKLNLSPEEPGEETAWQIAARKGYLFLPLVLLVGTLLKGYTPQLASAVGIAAVMVIMVITMGRSSFGAIVKALMDGAKWAIPVTAATACAGIVVGLVSLTGLGYKMTNLVISASGGSIALALVLSMLAAIVLGMGLPTSAAYIIMATLLAPALVQMGVTLVAAHLFLLYFASLSAITPPVALAAYVAAGLADANPMTTGWQAWKLGIAAFIVPFMFVYGPGLLLMGDPISIGITVITALIGAVLVAAAMEGWMKRPLGIAERTLLFLGGLLLIAPHPLWSLVGFIVGLLVLRPARMVKSVSPTT